MKNRDAEKKIKKMVNNIKMKKFSERWEEIKDRLPKKEQRVDFRKWVTVFSSGICLIFFVIFLPVFFLCNGMFQKENSYFDLSEVLAESVTKEAFYSQLETVDFLIIDFSELSIDNYQLIKTEDNVIRGGRIVFENLDEDKDYVYTITFYDKTVNIEEETRYFDLNQNITVNNIGIKFKTEEIDGIYETVALAKKEEISYIIEYSSLNMDVEDFFNIVFSEGEDS